MSDTLPPYQTFDSALKASFALVFSSFDNLWEDKIQCNHCLSRRALPGDDKEEEGDGNEYVDEDDEAVHEGGGVEAS